MAGPLYIALVDETATTFTSEYERNDLEFLTLLIECRENAKPLLTLEIKNPYTSLLNSDSAGSLNWIWISEDTGTSAGVVPRFFGHIIAIPDDLEAEVIKVQWVAEAIDWLSQKQLYFENNLKAGPNYDPLYYDLSVRDNPDSIEGQSGSYYFDPIALPATAGGSVSFSDWINAEAGTFQFTSSPVSPTDPAAVPYDSMRGPIKGKAPLQAITFECEVHWNQVTTGTINFGTRTFNTYCGNSLIGAWPRPGTTLESGWNVWASLAVDLLGTQTAIPLTIHYQWQNQEQTHQTGDTMSVNLSYTYPSTFTPGLIPGRSGEAGGLTYTLSYVLQGHVLQAGGGGYPTINTPLIYEASYLNVLPYSINGSLWLRYDRSAKYTETATFTMPIDVQPFEVVINEFPNPEFELIQKTGIDVGVPLLNVLDWSSVQGQPVRAGTLIFPNDPSYPGGQSYQIYTSAGTTGTTPPEFSDIEGQPTADGGATAVSLGLSPTLSAVNWTPNLSCPAGLVLNPIFLDYLNYAALIAPGLTVFPNVGVAVGLNTIVQAPNGYFFWCTLDGTTGAPVLPSWPASYGAVVVDGSVEWTCIGSTLPDGTDFYLCTNPGLSQLFLPAFNNATAGTSTTADGANIDWLYLGKVGDSFGIPVGGATGDVTARTFFASTRGNQFVETMLCVARAKGLWRARNVNIDFDCTWDAAAEINLRMNAQLYDDRLPGGVAVGKIIAYELRINGDEMLWDGHVTMACTIGNGGTIADIDGTPTYATNYNPPGAYQYWANSTTALETADIGWTPPAANPQDDGLQFPLNEVQVTLVNEIRNSMATELVAINAYAAQQQAIAKAGLFAAQNNPIFQAQGNQQLMQLAKSAISFDNQINGKNVWWDLQLVPLTDLQFSTDYNIVTTALLPPMTIDLSLPGTPP